MLTFGGKVDSSAIRSFYIRRAFRIVPLFWVAILFYLLITKGEGFKLWAPDGVSTGDVVLTFLFLHWSSVTAFNSVVPGGWSIAVEMQFYLLFPLLICLFRRPNGPILVYAGIALVSVIGKFAADWVLAAAPRRVAAAGPGLSRQRLLLLLAAATADLLRLRHFAVRLRRAEEQDRRSGRRCWSGRRCVYSAWGAEVVLLFALACGMLASNVDALARLSARAPLLRDLPRALRLVSAITALWPMGLVPLFVLVTGASLAAELFRDRAFDRAPFQPARSCPGIAGCRGPPAAQGDRNRHLKRRELAAPPRL